ncbi:glycosyltransferase family 2 protein [Actinomyces sp. Z5]|uniref:glycosyltransferase family 2 protein n=1 Tax=Actinomyces sp. Z5 TaxID=2250216 RepID=UPI000DCC24B5|nr:glycosyltransferase [Actinomyces sp. Z5]RAX21365.1 glycosyltransferase family 2 protein [Actinomyces sp. Z5]
MSQAGSAAQQPAPGGVLAVLVSAGVTPYLPETLHALAGQTVAPDVLLIVDVASRANGLGDGTPIEEAVVESGTDAVTAVRVVHVPEATGFGDAVGRGLTKYAELIAKGNRKRRRHRDHFAGSRQTDRPDATTGAVTTASGQLTGPTGAMSPISDTEIYRATGVDAPAAQPTEGSWLWLLHDDSAPDPDCLAALLAAVRTARSIALAGPKQVDWERPHELLEVGLRTTASARRANDVVEGEVDQGQHDDRTDMLAVGTAGALIDRAVWDQLGGISPAFPLFDDGLELSRAVRLAGHRVVVVPDAVLRHRRASYLGLRPAQQPHGPHRVPGHADQSDTPPTVAVPEPDPDRSFRARRSAQLTAWATFSARPLPLLLAWIVLLGLARAAWRLLTKAPALARDELAAALAVARSGAAIRRGRRRLAAHQDVRRTVLSELYVSAADIRAARRDRRRQERERAAREAARSELELRELAALTRRRRLVLAGVLIVAGAFAAVGLSQVLVARTVTGGALPGLGVSGRDLWDAAWSTWGGSGDGYPAALSPLLATLALPVAVGSWVGLDGDALVHILLVLAVPLAALGAWYAAGTVTRRNPLRAWAALVWALAPGLLLAVGQGRLTAVIVHLTLPWALTALARAVGADRRDVVLSGMVGARHATQAEKAELDRFAAARIEDLAELADDDPAAPQEAQDQLAEVADASEADAPGDASEADALAASEASADAEPPATDAAAAESVEVPEAAGPPLPLPERYGPGSPTAAAAAGLLLSLIVAAAPATAALILVGLIVLTACMRRSAPRLLLTLVPVAATATPAWWRAARLAQAGDVDDGVHYLLTDTGLPAAVAPPSTIETLLGMPQDVESLIADPNLALTAKALLAIVPVAAVFGLLTGGRRGNCARAGFLMALGGLALAAAGTRVIVAVGTQTDGTGSVTVAAWAGTGVSFALAGLLTAALAAGDAAYAALPAHAPGWRRWARVGLVGAGVIAVAAPLSVGGAWALAAHASTATGTDADVMALRSAGSRIPLIAAEIQSSDTAGRVLILSGGDSGLRVRIWRGDGTQLTDVTPDVLTTQLATRMASGTAAAASPAPATTAVDDPLTTTLTDPADAELADLVVRAAAGQDEDVADALAAHGIAVVLLTDAAGDELTASTRAGLESTPGLEQLARTDSGTSWRVAPAAAPESARAVLQAADGTATTIPANATGATAVRTALQAGTGRRVLMLAERNDGAWRATLNGEPLAATTVPDAAGRWRTAFIVPADGGELVVTHGTTLGAIAARGIPVIWVITALFALPLRRRRRTV